MSAMRLLLSYDGAGFSGFQSQPGRRTVQGTVESALERVASRPVRVAGAGRTDAGVHAVGQVVSCSRPRDLGDEEILRALAGLLPSDVAVVDASEATTEFHARRDARWRSYAYLVWNHRSPNPLFGRFATWTPRPVDVGLLHEALQAVVGTHDFSSFARVREDQSPVRTVLGATAEAAGELIRIRIRADAFLHQMVRSIVGSALEVATERRPLQWMREVLEARSRTYAGPVSPPGGLTLIEVGYDDVTWPRSPEMPWPWADRGERTSGRSASRERPADVLGSAATAK